MYVHMCSCRHAVDTVHYITVAEEGCDDGDHTEDGYPNTKRQYDDDAGHGNREQFEDGDGEQQQVKHGDEHGNKDSMKESEDEDETGCYIQTWFYEH